MMHVQTLYSRHVLRLTVKADALVGVVLVRHADAMLVALALLATLPLNRALVAHERLLLQAQAAGPIQLCWLEPCAAM